MENVLEQGYFKNAGALVEWSLLENVDLLITSEQEIIEQRLANLRFNFIDIVKQCIEVYASGNTYLINDWMQWYHAFRDYCLESMSEEQFCVMWNTVNHELKNK